VAEDIANRRLQKTQAFQTQQADIAHKRAMELIKQKAELKESDEWQSLQPMEIAGQTVLPQVNKRTGLVKYEKFKKPGTDKDGGFAPDQETWVSNDGSKTRTVNVRDPKDVAKAEAEGFRAVGPKQRGYFRQEGRSGAEYVSEVSKASAKARASVTTLDTMGQLLDRFESGKLAKWKMKIQQWANAFDIPVDATNLSSKEAFQAMAEQLALQSRNMGEGMVLAGQMSDRDVQFLRDMNPQLVISKGGNRLIINMRKSIAKRNSEIAKLAKEYRDKNNGVVDQLGFEEYVSQKFSKTSIFGIPNGAKLYGTDKKTGLPVYESDGKYYIPEF
jgi:hypothetical protein